ncbi:MAG: ubiquinol-cytochrome c reductase iron-sulfur subunit [Nitrospirae bacterium]|nr:ubiquinol-cytochrome c reductase iron-sulfur subunit [Nitrospirota bacterium]
MKRRKFLKSLLAVLGSTTVVSFAYPLVRFIAPPGKKAEAERLSLRKDEIPAGESKEIVFNNTPAIIINRPGKGYIALSKVCTHLGCLVEFNKEKGSLICPCHAGEFNLDGKVLSGPPPKPLAEFPLRVEGESIIVG